MPSRLALLVAPLCLLACSVDDLPFGQKPKELRIGSGPVIDYSADNLALAQDLLARGKRDEARLAFIRALDARHRAAALRGLAECGTEAERRLCADAVRGREAEHSGPAIRLVARYLGDLRVGSTLSRDRIVAVAYDASGAPLNVEEIFIKPGPSFSPTHVTTDAGRSHVRVTDLARQLSVDCPVEVLPAE